MIEVNGISKKYGGKAALRDVSFSVKKGQVLGLLGRNGAGKSTTMNIMTGYLSADEGSVRIGGYDILEEPIKAKKLIGYLPEIPPLYPEMTVTEYLHFVCRLKGMDRKDIIPFIEQTVELVNIGDVRNKLIGNLSKGYRQRVGLAQALCGSPEAIILDEPTIGLDPMQIIEMRSIVRDLGTDRAVILSSHILKEISDVCTDVVIINNGKKLVESSLSVLLGGSGEQASVALRVSDAESDDNESEFIRKLRGISGVLDVVSSGKGEPGFSDYEIISSGADTRSAVFNVVSESKRVLVLMAFNSGSLEDIFTKLIHAEEQESV